MGRGGVGWGGVGWGGVGWGGVGWGGVAVQSVPTTAGRSTCIDPIIIDQSAALQGSQQKVIDSLHILHEYHLTPKCRPEILIWNGNSVRDHLKIN